MMALVPVVVTSILAAIAGFIAIAIDRRQRRQNQQQSK